MMESDESAHKIAVIGMAGRFPGAGDIAAYWQLLAEGREAVRFFSPEQLRERGVPEEFIANPDFVPAAAVLDDADQFDAAYFGYSPVEAQAMDPQQRVLLECAVAALEDAGRAGPADGQRVAVFCGVTRSGYLLQHLLKNDNFLGRINQLQMIIASDKSFAATQLSYKLNLTGPSMAVDSACSTSLVAVHQACQSLLSYECDMALAGGASIAMPGQTGHVYQQGGIFSPDGHCRPFDVRAQGTVRGSGAGMVVLKRYDDALADGDSIDAVILASAINNDGAAKVGFTAPSVGGQKRVIETVHALAGVAADSIGLIEAHGTGTGLGDPIEVAALSEAFALSSARRQFCALGSVKGNIGHLDAAAGVAGLIKAVLALRHKQLPPSLHFEHENAEIDFARSPFFVNTVLRDWPAGATPRRAAVSAFGIGGTNAHVLLEEAAPAAPGAAGGAQVLLLSARSAPALQAAKAQLAQALSAPAAPPLALVAATLQSGRKEHAYRFSCVCDSAAAAAAALSAPAPAVAASGAERPRIALLFPGQGAQYGAMAAGLYAAHARFGAELDLCCAKFLPALGPELREVLLAPPERRAAADLLLEQTRYAQAALFVVEYALAMELRERGIEPDLMLGHSLGELVAATIAGVFSLDDAVLVVSARARLMQDSAPGAMLAVNLSPAELAPYLDSESEVAAYNGARQLVVAGAPDSIAQLEARLGRAFAPTRRLPVARAFHSALMQPVLAEFRALLAGLTLQPPRIAMISSVTGTALTAAQACDPDYWASQIRLPVRFDAALASLDAARPAIVIEAGPGKALSTFAQAQPLAGPPLFISAIGQRDDGAGHALLPALAALWRAGAAVNWRADGAADPGRVHLPGTAFERQRYWVEPAPAAAPRAAHGQALLYQAGWVRAPLGGAAAPTPARYIVFENDRRFSQHLRGLGHASVHSVCHGDAFAQCGAADFTLRPEAASDYAALIQAARLAGPEPVRIVYLWSCGQRRPDPAALLALAASLPLLAPGAALALACVTGASADLDGTEAIVPEQAAAAAICKVMGQEHPHLRVACIDLGQATEQPGLALDGWAGALLTEFDHGLGAPQVAWRGTRRWLPHYRRLERAAAAPVASAALRRGGVYLITGGLGRIGLALAEFLARQYGARIAIVTHQALPERDAWDALLEGACAPQLQRKLSALQGLAAGGHQVQVYCADVADLAAMTAVLGAVERELGPVNGVFHAAAHVAAESFQLAAHTAPATLALHYRPKVGGAQVLDTLLAAREADFCMLFSSIATLLGGMGFAAYAAANAWLDGAAMAHERAPGRTRWISVNLDAWSSAAGAGAKVSAGMHAAQAALDPGAGLAALCALLQDSCAPCVVVAAADLAPRLALPDTPRQDGPAAAAPALPAAGLRPELDVPYVGARDEVEDMLVLLWQELLGIEGIGVHDPFVELGGHSLSAMQLIARMRKEFGVAVPLHVFFSTPTVAGLAAHIVESMLAGAGDDELRALMSELPQETDEPARKHA